MGGKGRDVLVGGSGIDKLVGGDGRDRLLAGPGDDLVAAAPKGPRDREKVIDCGPGQDVAKIDLGVDPQPRRCEFVEWQ